MKTLAYAFLIIVVLHALARLAHAHLTISGDQFLVYAAVSIGAYLLAAGNEARA